MQRQKHVCLFRCDAAWQRRPKWRLHATVADVDVECEPWIAMDGDVGTKDAIAIGLAAIEGTFGIGIEDALGIASEGALGIASGLAAIRAAH